MSADYRRECLSKLPEKALQRICLPELDRQYTLSEIAILISAGPARALGLAAKGHLGVGADADLVIYEQDDDIARMFGHPRYVIKGGEVVLEDGEIRAVPDGRSMLVQPSFDPTTEEFLRPLFEDYYTMSFENYPVELHRVSRSEIHECRPAV
jgi:formylmethanofuran dehydrogenase subunit A